MKTRSGLALRSVGGVLAAVGLVGLWGAAGKSEPSTTPESSIELPFYTEPSLTPRWADTEPETPAAHRTAPFRLTDQMGRPVSEVEVDGRIHVVSFFFTSCGQVCPMTVHNLKGVQRAFQTEDDVVLLSFSVTPEMDSVPVLRGFGEAHGIDPEKWRLLTGSRSTIFALADSSYFVELEEDELYEADALFHTETVVLLDGERRIRGVYNGTLSFDIQRLVEDIHTLREST